MSEIYRNSAQEIYLDLHGAEADDLPEVTVTVDGDDTSLTPYYPPTTIEGEGSEPDTQRWTAFLSLQFTQADQEVKVTWDFEITGDAAQKVEYFDVVTPYVELDDIRYELEVPANVTDEKLVWAERKARRIIDQYCNQKFGARNETYFVRGSGSRSLQLPARLISVEEAVRTDYSEVPLTGYQIRNDGWSMKRFWDFSTDGTVYYTNPISNPLTKAANVFPSGLEWSIKGRWGWERVPAAVRDAALLIIEQELCPQAVYRERFITSMSFGDTKLEMDPEAWRGTGNAVADQILSPYVARGVALI